MSEMINQNIPACPICGREGRILYPEVRDLFYDNAGTFSSRQCPACGFIWLSPRPAPEDMGRFYRDYFTHDSAAPAAAAVGGKRFLGRFRDLLRESIVCGYYGYKNVHARHVLCALGRYIGRIHFLRERAVNEFQALPVYKNGGRVLDVGCGNGDLLFRLKQLGWEVMGIETDPLAAETARGRGITVGSEPLEKSGLPENWADVVIMNHVLEHLYEPVSALRECRRILKADGTLTLYTPNALSLGHEVFGPYWRALDAPRHLQIFSPSTLRAALAAAGFSKAEIRTSAWSAMGVYNASAAIAKEGSLKGRDARQQEGALSFAMKEAALCALGFPKGEELEAACRK
jgi:SAM-dependent methyltransferase